MSVKLALDLKDTEAAQKIEDQGKAETDGAEGDAFSERHSDKRTVMIISSI
jgi:hypothetical protein